MKGIKSKGTFVHNWERKSMPVEGIQMCCPPSSLGSLPYGHSGNVVRPAEGVIHILKKNHYVSVGGLV